MTGPIVPILAALIVQFALGLIVFQANRHRLANQCFLLLSLIIDVWLASLYLAFISRTPAAAECAIRQASASGALYLVTLNLLRLSIRQKQQNWRDVFRNSRVWIALTVTVVVWCQTKLFLKGALMPHEIGGAPAPIYRQWAGSLYGAYFAVGLTVLVISRS